MRANSDTSQGVARGQCACCRMVAWCGRGYQRSGISDQDARSRRAPQNNDFGMHPSANLYTACCPKVAFETTRSKRKTIHKEPYFISLLIAITSEFVGSLHASISLARTQKSAACVALQPPTRLAGYSPCQTVQECERRTILDSIQPLAVLLS